MRKQASPTFLPGFLPGALALGFAATLAAACPSARADGASDGLGTDALVAAVPHGGGGWSNGAAALIANGDGNPVVEYRAPRGATALALLRG